VAVEIESAHSVALRFAVTDTGIGISEDSQRRIFESFAQADGSGAQVWRDRSGSVDLKAINCENGRGTEGRGSTFWFVLPFEKAHGKHAGAGEDRSDSKTDS